MSVHFLKLRNKDAEPVTLDAFLRNRLPDELSKISGPTTASGSKIRRLIIAGAVQVNGHPIRRPGFILSSGSWIFVRLDTAKFNFEKQNNDIHFELTNDRILYEDDVIIVVDKPANFPTEATIVNSRDHLQAAVARYLSKNADQQSGSQSEDSLPYVGIHHRLDRETSGVILFTKTKAINSIVHRMFLEHTVQKEYQALTVRPKKLPDAKFYIDNSLARISPKSAPCKWGAVPNGGQKAHTDFQLQEVYPSGLRIQAILQTGRTHQIRVHLTELGMPLLGDVLYGGPAQAGGRSCSRVMLHAAALTFPHPLDDTRTIHVEAPFPDDFIACMESIKN